MKIVVLDGYALNPGDLSWEGFAALGDIAVYERTPKEEIDARIGDAALVLTNKTPITRETLKACPALRYVGVLATGYNVVDEKAAGEQGVTVTNIPTYGTDAVAQYVFALLLEICHQVGAHVQSVRDGDWSRCPDFCYWNNPLIELRGKTMGIVGFGRIGRAVAQLAVAFGMEVLACDAHAAGDCTPAKMVRLSQLLAQSDVVSLHCPLSDETQGIIRKETIAQMKDGAILINTARGPLVREDDLAQALKSGKLYAAALDVVAQEPVREDNSLLRCKNCQITPQNAWAPSESRQRLMDISVQNLASYLKGKPVNVVIR